MSAMHFEDLNLNKPLLKALDDLGIKHPTTIQQKAFSVIMSGRDVVGIAQTGTGKTFAYILPLLRLWKFTPDPNPQILILVPTRELVIQVVEEVKKLSAYMNVRVAGAYGGTNIQSQKDAIDEGLDILVGTPGRLLDLAYSGTLKLKFIKKLVIDEVDEMLNEGFRHQLKDLFDLLPEKRQNLMFSATLSPEVETIIESQFNSPLRIEAAPAGTPLENIDQRAYAVPNFNTKLNLLTYLLDHHTEMNKVLVFTDSKRIADEVFECMVDKFPGQVQVIHSNKTQSHRFNAVKNFHAGNTRILIATDVIARGIDVSEVSHVINFDLPEVPENYIHRIGRTGRVGKKGNAIAFIVERDLEKQEEIEALMNNKIPMEKLPEDLEISKVLMPYEEKQISTHVPQIKIPKRQSSGPAFHEKKEKNKKVNNKIRKEEAMRLKYGKSKTRGDKRQNQKRKKK